MQRLGWLPHFKELKCRRTVAASLCRGAPIFTCDHNYPVTTERVKVQFKERRARRDGVSEPVTYTGSEMMVRIKDNQGNWHRCLPNPANTHALIHDLVFLVRHFEIPKVPDLATLHRKQFNHYKRKLKELENHATIQTKS